jgi:hypothetical protein
MVSPNVCDEGVLYTLVTFRCLVLEVDHGSMIPSPGTEVSHKSKMKEGFQQFVRASWSPAETRRCTMKVRKGNGHKVPHSPGLYATWLSYQTYKKEQNYKWRSLFEKQNRNKLHGLCPQANYSDRRLSAKLVPTFADRGLSHSQWDASLRPYSQLSRPEPLLFLLSSSSVLLMRLSGLRSRPTTSQKIWNRARDLRICSRELWRLDHRGGFFLFVEKLEFKIC